MDLITLRLVNLLQMYTRKPELQTGAKTSRQKKDAIGYIMGKVALSVFVVWPILGIKPLFVCICVKMYAYLLSENHKCSRCTCNCRACSYLHAPLDCHSNQMHIFIKRGKTRKKAAFELSYFCIRPTWWTEKTGLFFHFSNVHEHWKSSGMWLTHSTWFDM